MHTLSPSATALFLSDLHLGDGSHSDLFGNQDDALVQFLESWSNQADAIVLLGDLFDLPQAWSMARIRAAHPGVIAAIDRLSRSRTNVVIVPGNHDWNVRFHDIFPAATVAAQVHIGERILAWHGHQMDLFMRPEAKSAALKMVIHSFMERVTRSRLIPPLERYDSLANRITVALGVQLGRVHMLRAGRLRRRGQDELAAELETAVHFLARTVVGDPANLFGATRERVLRSEGFDTVVCGHSHLAGQVHTEDGTYVNTGSWTCGYRECALWTGSEFRVLDLNREGREIGDDAYVDVPDESEPADLFRWWDAHYRGYLRFDL